LIDVRVKLTYPDDLIREPVMARLVREHDVVPNIRGAHVDAEEGWIVCEIEGEPDRVEAAIDWLRDQGIRVDLLGDLVES
jgi:L-aspartate semialdehyde sulfurtransferase ferredoxin